MAKFKLRVSKKTRFMGHLFASASFVGLFIWGWDLPVSEAVAYLILLFGFLLGIILLSAVLGLILRVVRGNSIVFDDQQEIERLQRLDNTKMLKDQKNVASKAHTTSQLDHKLRDEY